MNTPKDDTFNINFFKPHSQMSRDDNKVITVFILIWAVAVFGFQFLLIGTNKMTPEDNLITFNELWPKVQSAEVTTQEQQAFSKSLLKVLGKNIVLTKEDKDILKESLSLTIIKMDPNCPLEPEAVTKILQLGNKGFDPLITELLPFSLVTPTTSAYSDELPGLMKKYCTHPQGPLTNFTFLGFPFHYWYTAQFLLILFVLLCLFYSIKIDKIHAKHNFVEDHS